MSVHRIRAALLMLAGLLTVAPAVAGTNLVTNPGFEQEFKAWNRPRRPSGADTGTLDLVIDTRTTHAGRASAHLTLDFEQNAQFFCPTQTVQVFPDTEYLLTAYIRTRLASGAIHMEIQDARGWQLFLRSSEPLSGRTDWAKVQLAFRTSLTTEAIRIGLRHIGRPGDKTSMRGQVWLDDVSLVAKESGRPQLTRAELERAIRESKLETFENDAMRIALAVPRVRVREIAFKQRPELKLAAEVFPELPLYVITLEDANGRTQEIRSVDAVSVSAEKAATGRGGSYLLRMRHVGALTGVTVRVALDPSGFVDLTLIQVDPQPRWSVRRLVFPQVVTPGLVSDEPADTFVVIGGDEPVSLGQGWRYEMRSRVYPVSARLPILCQYGPAGGVSLMALDADQWVKNVEMQPVVKRAGGVPTSIVWRYVVRVAPGDPLPQYTARLGLIEHSPYEAAEVYRDWASRQPWFPKPLSQRSDVGPWRLRGVPHYFIYLPEAGPNMLNKHPLQMTPEERARQQNQPGGGRFRLREVPAVMESLPKEITELGGVVDLRGWEKWGLWMNPDWWPPRQGEDVLRRATGAIHRAGLHITADVMFYNLKIHLPKEQHGFGTAGREALQRLGIVPEDVAIKDEQGKIVSMGAGIYRGNVVCPTARIPFDHAVWTLRRMKEAGFDDVQFDGGGHSIGLACWNRQHSHPPGPGQWQTAAARDYYERVRDAIPGSRESGFGFVEEYFNEVRAHSYVAIYTRCEQVRNVRRRAENLSSGSRMTPLPSLFSFVYHGRVVETGFFGSYGPAAYAAAANVAFGVCAGPQPTPWLTFRDILDQPWVRIFVDGTKARQTFAHDYLLLGRMLQPVATEPRVTLKIGLKDERTGKWRSKDVQVPAIIQQAYRSPEGKIGWVLVNHTSQRVTCVPQRPLPAWFSALKSIGSIRRVTVQGSRRMEPSELMSLTVEPLEVVLIE